MPDGPLRVLHVTPAERPGGGPEHIRLLCAFASESVAPAVAHPPRAGWVSRLPERVPTRAIETSRALPSVAFSLRRTIRELGAQIVHAHGRGAALHARVGAKLARVPLVYTLHGTHREEPARLRDRMTSAAERALNGLVRRTIAVSEEERSLALQLELSPPSRIRLIRNACDPAYVEASLKEAPRADEPLRLLSVARPGRHKGIEDLPVVLRALKDVEVEWTVIGMTPDEATTDDPRVLWLGPRDDGIEPELYQEHHVFVSLARWEGLPLAPLEAASAGVPVVATPVRGHRELLEALGTAELLRPVEGMPEAIAWLRDGERWVRFSDLVREGALAWPSVADMVRQTEAVYREALADP